MSDEIAYRIITRALNDQSFFESLKLNAIEAINNEGISDSNEVRKLIGVINLIITGSISSNNSLKLLDEQLQEQRGTTFAVANAMKKAIQITVKQIDDAYSSTMLMYTVTFYLGITLVILAAIVAVISKDTLLPTIFGTLGIADLVAFLITKPPERLQNSRASLAQLQGAFFNWFTDVYNWNTYLTLLQQQNKLELTQMQQISDILMTNTDKTMSMLQKYCKLIESGESGKEAH